MNTHTHTPQHTHTHTPQHNPKAILVTGGKLILSSKDAGIEVRVTLCGVRVRVGFGTKVMGRVKRHRSSFCVCTHPCVFLCVRACHQ